ncbi:polysaccharide deacetylase [Tumebacillus sp. BK434]|uniref:polysaccharide deacetylase family protein n=1 Tax=Tumebacillus sp. BK434 TaxID=2512169 RepID=UPI001047B673|nr:polysaccharide deacetylase family protein [Tumebacillus sp. BK434]TCP53429.1 polysaccharide deacetylase [Tumebacillus sp. BK434]
MIKKRFRSGLSLLVVLAALQVSAVGSASAGQVVQVTEGIQYAVKLPRPYVIRTATRSEVWTSEVPILEYHAFSKQQKQDVWYVAADAFEKQLRYLAEHGYNSISFQDLAKAWYENRPLPPKPVILSIDDGYMNNYTIAYPLLKKYKMKAVIFLTTNMIGADANHVGWREIQEMEASGLVTFEAHGVSHQYLTKIPEAQARREVFEAKRVLDERLEHPVVAFSYPGGYNSPKIRSTVKEAGYLFGTVAKGGYASMSQGAYELHRIIVNGKEPPYQFVKSLK